MCKYNLTNCHPLWQNGSHSIAPKIFITRVKIMRIPEAQTFDVVILGAGLSGTLIAAELPRDLNILLVEIGEEIIPHRSTSYNQCNKLHLGLHYAGNSETAQKCLEDSLAFASKYKPYVFGQLNDPWRRGRYFIMSNSLFGLEQVESLGDSLSDLYSKEAKKTNYVFGDPKEFIKKIRRDQYSEVADTILFTDEDGDQKTVSVAVGMETAESQIDIKSLKDHLKKTIQSNKNITFIPNSDAKKISFNPDTLTYSIVIQNTKTKYEEVVFSQSVINCTWQNTESLDDPEIQHEKQKQLVRVKASILVKLPNDLAHFNTCTFAVGPFCSFTNLGNGTAILTEETASNIGQYFAGDRPTAQLESLMQSSSFLESPAGRELASNVLLKSSAFIPKLKEASILSLHFGCVKIMTQDPNCSLYSTESPIHSRLESGIEEKGLGHISASGMKMTYTLQNALTVKNLLAEHIAIKKALKLMLNEKSALMARKPGHASVLNYLKLKTGLSSDQLNQALPPKQLASILGKTHRIQRKHAMLNKVLSVEVMGCAVA